MTTENSKSGFALAVAVFALVVVGVLVTGGFYLARQETRIGIASERATTSFYLAERGAMEVMTEWDMSTFGSLANWGSATVADTSADGIWSVNVTKMSSRLYFLKATGTVTDGSGMMGNASRMLGMVARMSSAEILPRAALSVVGAITIRGSMEINGHDQNPSDWSGYCDPAGASKPGIMIDDLSNIDARGAALIVDGDPAFAQDPTMTSDSLLTFGDLQWNDLVLLAEKTYSDGFRITTVAADSLNVSGNYVCNTANRDNWGTPLNPGGVCGSYFPIILIDGSAKISSNGTGQGILLVDGDLDIAGAFVFYGPVIIRGTLTASGGGTGGHFQGGVIAANVDLDVTTVTGNAVVEYSSCAVSRAILNNSNLTRVRPLEDRSWVDLSSVISG